MPMCINGKVPPSSSFTPHYICLGNETYLLFANVFEINRVSLNGSSFQTVYNDSVSSVIVGLDYHYRLDTVLNRMYEV